MKKGILYYVMALFLVVSSCSKDKDDNNGGGTGEEQEYSLTGFVQKGPFINGSTITLSELQSDLTPTGRTFTTQIADNSGNFSFANISLISPLVQLKADGFYFNEVCGNQSAAQITLYALTDLSNNTALNVNLLTHLEKSRVEYLVEQGSTFTDAKTQAQTEVLDIFNVSATGIAASELLNLSQSGQGNNVLLAISAILQGYRSDAELSELLADMVTDLRVDGVVNSASTGEKLLSHAQSIDTAAVKNNLNDRYVDMGLTASVDGFGAHLANFVANTSFTSSVGVINYPAIGGYGANILAPSVTSYSAVSTISMVAEVPNCTAFKVQVTATSGGIWYFDVISVNNWTITTFDLVTNSQWFTVTNDGEDTDLSMEFDAGTYQVDYYEMNSTLPTFSKTITVN